MSIQNLFFLPVVGKKIQLPEFIFLSIIIFLTINFRAIRWRNIKLNGLDFVLLSYPLIILLTGVFSSNISPFLEFIGLIYLFINYTQLRLFFNETNIRVESFIFQSIKWMGIVAAFSGLTGVLLATFHIENALVANYLNYPYFGDTIRSFGFTPTPNMLASILGVSILMLFSKLLFNKNMRLLNFILLVFMLLAYFFTYSKGIIIIGVGVFFILYHSNYLNRFFKKLILVISSLLILIYIIGVHFIIVHKNNPKFNDILGQKEFTSGVIIGEFSDYKVLPTCYLSLKKASYQTGVQNFFTGIGAGNFGNHIKNLKREGAFPLKMPNYDPHSTYLGGFAELGIFGLISSFGIVFFGFFIAKIILIKQINNSIAIGVIACAIVFSLEATSTDILNFRHLWIIFACMGFYFYNKNKQSD